MPVSATGKKKRAWYTKARQSGQGQGEAQGGTNISIDASATATDRAALLHRGQQLLERLDDDRLQAVLPILDFLYTQQVITDLNSEIYTLIRGKKTGDVVIRAHNGEVAELKVTLHRKLSRTALVG